MLYMTIVQNVDKCTNRENECTGPVQYLLYLSAISKHATVTKVGLDRAVVETRPSCGLYMTTRPKGPSSLTTAGVSDVLTSPWSWGIGVPAAGSIAVEPHWIASSIAMRPRRALMREAERLPVLIQSAVLTPLHWLSPASGVCTRLCLFTHLQCRGREIWSGLQENAPSPKFVYNSGLGGGKQNAADRRCIVPLRSAARLPERRLAEPGHMVPPACPVASSSMRGNGQETHSSWSLAPRSVAVVHSKTWEQSQRLAASSRYRAQRLRLCAR